MPGWQEKLNLSLLGEFSVLYSALEVPPISSLSGHFRGAFVGSGWSRAAARPALVVAGLYVADGGAVPVNVGSTPA